jgi:hypothetical protein
MEEPGRQKSIFQCATETPSPSAIIPYCDNESTSRKLVQYIGSAYDRAFAKGPARFASVVVDEDDTVKLSVLASDIQDYFRVSAGSPDD